MKARLNTDRVVYFLDLNNEVSQGASFVVEASKAIFTSRATGTSSVSLTMSPVANEPSLHVSAPFYVGEVGNFELSYKVNNQAVYQEILNVGLDPVSDYEVLAKKDLVADSQLAGGISESVQAYVYDRAGKVYGPEVYATFTGNADVTSTFILPNEKLVLDIGDGADLDVIFYATAAVATGAAGTFDAGVAADVAKYSVNGTRALDLTIDGATTVAGYVSKLNEQLKGVTATENGGQLVLTSDILGYDSSITLSGFAGDFGTKTGLSAETVSSAPNNVNNSEKVTFAEVRAVIESVAVLTTVTQEASTGYLTITSNKVDGADNAILGQSTKLDLKAASDATLVTRLGLGELGTQGGFSAAAGSDGTAYATLYDSAKAGYVLEDFAFGAPGIYFVVWKKLVGAAFVPFSGVSPFVVKPVGKEKVEICVKEKEDTTQNPQEGVRTYVCNLDGSQVAMSVTDSKGYALFDLYPGEYRAVFQKDDVVFAYTYIGLVVHDTASVAGDNPLAQKTATRTAQGVSIYNDPFVPTLSLPTVLVPMCDLYATLYMTDGIALPNADIYVSYVGSPQVLAGHGVVGGKFSYKTDSNGYVEFKLIQGVKVEVSVALMSIRRILTIPSGDDAVSPVNLLTLLADSDDLFDIISAVKPVAPRRTL